VIVESLIGFFFGVASLVIPRRASAN